MTKKELVRHLSERTRLPQAQVRTVVDLMLDTILEALVEDGRIEFRNFGAFAVKTRKARVHRSPQDASAIQVEARTVVTFHPGKIMEERVRHVQTRFPPPPTGRGVLAGHALNGRPHKPR